MSTPWSPPQLSRPGAQSSLQPGTLTSHYRPSQPRGIPQNPPSDDDDEPPPPGNFSHSTSNLSANLNNFNHSPNPSPNPTNSNLNFSTHFLPPNQRLPNSSSNPHMINSISTTNSIEINSSSIPTTSNPIPNSNLIPNSTPNSISTNSNSIPTNSSSTHLIPNSTPPTPNSTTTTTTTTTTPNPPSVPSSPPFPSTPPRSSTQSGPSNPHYDSLSTQTPQNDALSTQTPPVIPSSLSGGISGGISGLSSNSVQKYCPIRSEWIDGEHDAEDQEFFEMARSGRFSRRNANAHCTAPITSSTITSSTKPLTSPHSTTSASPPPSASSLGNTSILGGNLSNLEGNLSNLQDVLDTKVGTSAPNPLTTTPLPSQSPSPSPSGPKSMISQSKTVSFHTQYLPGTSHPIPTPPSLTHSRSYAKLDIAPPPALTTKHQSPVMVPAIPVQERYRQSISVANHHYNTTRNTSFMPGRGSFSSQNQLLSSTIDEGLYNDSDGDGGDDSGSVRGHNDDEQGSFNVVGCSFRGYSSSACSQASMDGGSRLPGYNTSLLGILVPDPDQLGEDWWTPQCEMLPAETFPYTLTTKALQNLDQYVPTSFLHPTITPLQLEQQRVQMIQWEQEQQHQQTTITTTTTNTNNSANNPNNSNISSISTPNSLYTSPGDDSVLPPPPPPPESQYTQESTHHTQSMQQSQSAESFTSTPSFIVPNYVCATETSESSTEEPHFRLTIGGGPLPTSGSASGIQNSGGSDGINNNTSSNINNNNNTNSNIMNNNNNINNDSTTTPASLAPPTPPKAPTATPVAPTFNNTLNLTSFNYMNTYGPSFFQKNGPIPLTSRPTIGFGGLSTTCPRPQSPGGIMGTQNNAGNSALAVPFTDIVLKSLSSLPPVATIMSPISEALNTQRTAATMPQSILHKQTTIKDELIGMDKARSLWEFEDTRVKKRYDFFRASTLLHTRESTKPFDSWHFPQYFSQQPLSSGVIKKKISVMLQPEVAATLPGHRPQRKVLQVKSDDIVSTFIKTAINALYGTNNEDPSEFVFKVLGHQEYLDHPNLIFSYAYIRHCVRNNLDVELVLLKRPPVLEVTQEQQVVQDNLTSEYYTDLQESTISHIHHLFTSLPQIPMDLNTVPYHQAVNPPYIPLAQIDSPFSIQLLGIEGLNISTLPRYTPDISTVYLRIVLFHGVQQLPFDVHLPVHASGTELSVSNHTEQKSILLDPIIFNTTVYGGNNISEQILISALPREARIGFVLYGRRENAEKKNMLSPKTKTQHLEPGLMGGGGGVPISSSSSSDKDIQLGFVVNQLIDEYGHLISGRVSHRLWAFPADGGRKKVGGKRDKDPLFLYRANNHDNHLIITGQKPTCLLHIRYPSYSLPVFSPLIQPYVPPDEVRMMTIPKATQEKIQKVQTLLKTLTPLSLSRSPLTDDQRRDIFSCRLSLVNQPSALPVFLLSVNWGSIDQRNEAYRLLAQWASSSKPIDSISLLDVWYPDYRVRAHAVNQLKQLTDDELKLYLLQLVQCIKYEASHYSPLVQFLVERAVQSPYEIGYPLYWSFKSEVHDPIVMERFTFLLEHLIVHVGPILVDNLQRQSRSVRQLQSIADYVLHAKRGLHYSNEQALVHYREKLTVLNDTVLKPQGKFPIPLKPTLEATELIIDKCRFMSSKMVPLWLVFKNADPMGPPIYLIFKSGDDLRQDLLTLQILRILDRMWLDRGLDCRLKPYEVIATGVNDIGEGVGMIEVVLNSTTTADIQEEFGGGTLGAFKTKSIDTFIRQNNPPDSSFYQLAVENFVLSCAGYCVATYILGIGDRHNGNIMVTKGGHLFHIDFGHFLGNFKSKFGINRERTAFTFTPEMAYTVGQYIPPETTYALTSGLPEATVITHKDSLVGGNSPGSPTSVNAQRDLGLSLSQPITPYTGSSGNSNGTTSPGDAVNKPIEDYKGSNGLSYCKSVAGQAFQHCREQVWFLETLFVLLIPAGMPELVQDSDIDYLELKLQCQLDETAATNNLMVEFANAMGSTSRRIDNFFHLLKHSKK